MLALVCSYIARGVLFGSCTTSIEQKKKIGHTHPLDPGVVIGGTLFERVHYGRVWLPTARENALLQTNFGLFGRLPRSASLHAHEF